MAKNKIVVAAFRKIDCLNKTRIQFQFNWSYEHREILRPRAWCLLTAAYRGGALCYQNGCHYSLRLDAGGNMWI